MIVMAQQTNMMVLYMWNVTVIAQQNMTSVMVHYT